MVVWPLVTVGACAVCHTKAGWRRYTCSQCKTAGLCSACCDFPIVTNLNGLAGDVVSACKSCFRAASSLDFAVSVDTYGPSKDAATACVLFVHGGGGTRKMFRAHAEALAENFGIRSVCLDLPGHGALMESPLTTESAVARVFEVACEHCPAAGKTVYCGGSLGGAIGYSVMSRSASGSSPFTFRGFVIMMASQNTGVGRGVAASLGLMAMARVSRTFMLSFLLKHVAKSRDTIMSEIVVRDSLEPGMFFYQQAAQIALLREVDALDAAAQAAAAKIRVMYMYGLKDHHDIAARLEAIGGGTATNVAYNGDHFFSHQKDCFDDVVQRIAAFAQLS